MRPVYIAGRALASVLGRHLQQARAALQQVKLPPVSAYPLIGHPALPYMRIADSHATGWDARARALVTQVVLDAGGAQARDGALFIATSSQDGAAAEHSDHDMDFHALAARIGDWLEWRGPVFVVSSACTSSIQALLSAAEWLRAGHASEALVLGLELDNRLTLPGFAGLQLLSADSSKPFAAQRDGLVLGEAVAALRLSNQQEAPWLLRGGAQVVDGRQPTGATAEAVARMCRHALSASGLDCGAVDLIKVQAAGSPGNDAAEAEGLIAAFGEQLPALVSLKPWIGHCMGASGAAEIALLLDCLQYGLWPRYPHAADPALHVQLAAQMPARVRCVLADILGFGGSHAAVVLEQRP